MNTPIRFVLAGVLSLVAFGSVEAAPINVMLQTSPDIFSAFIDVNYNAGTNAFTATGFAFNLDAEPINNGTFNLTATITNAGVLTGGTLTINGDVPTLGFAGPTLLTGNLTALGFPNAGGDPLEFLFTPTGGDAVGLYAGTGGIILSQTNFPATLFTQSFTNVDPGIGFGLGVADTGVVVRPIPEPTTLAIGLVCGGLVVLNRRFRRQPVA